MFVAEFQQAGQAAYVAVHGAVRCTALTVHQTRGALGNDPIREEVLRRLGQKKVALHGLSDWSVPLVLAAVQITGERSQETLPAVLGMEYLAAAGRGLPTAAATVRSANGLSSEGSPGLNLVLPSSMRVSPTAYFMSVAVWYRSLKRCVQACDCKIVTPRYAPQFGSRLHFKRCQALPKGNPFSLFFRGPLFLGPLVFFFFCFFLALQRLARLNCNLEPNCKHI